MSRTSAVQHAIESRYERLSGQKRRIADYVLHNLPSAFALSVQELAVAAEVSQATVVRFARDVGFEGYQELRAALTEEAKAGLTPAARFAATDGGAAETTLERVAAQEIANIEVTIASLDRRAFERAAQLLRSATQVATLGGGVSSLLARVAAYQLQLVGVTASAIVDGPLALGEQVEILPRHACVLCFGFPPYSRAAVRAVERAKVLRLPVVAVTDGVRSPLRRLATAALTVRADNLLFSSSLSAALVVVNALITDVALADKPRALARIKALDAAGAAEHGG